MAVTISALQQDIIDEVGETDPPTLALRIDRLWDRFADKAAIHPRLQELYTKRACIDVVLGTLRSEVNFSHDGSITLSLSQRTSYLSDRRKETQAEIVKLETTARANRPAVVAPINVPPRMLPPMVATPDPDSALYRGSPDLPIGGTT